MTLTKSEIDSARYHGNLEVTKYLRMTGVNPDDVLLDLGANVGSISLGYVAAGVQRAVTVEATGRLCEVIEHWADDRITVLHGAVVQTSYADPTVTFRTYKKTIYSGLESIHGALGEPVSTITGKVITKPDAIEEVPALRLGDLLAKYRPTIVKCDVEGAEILFADELRELPDHVRALAIEWHPFRRESVHDTICDTHEYLLDNGWMDMRPKGRPYRGRVHTLNTTVAGYRRS